MSRRTYLALRIAGLVLEFATFVVLSMLAGKAIGVGPWVVIAGACIGLVASIVIERVVDLDPRR